MTVEAGTRTQGFGEERVESRATRNRSIAAPGLLCGAVQHG
ncbi:hypothetical protein OAV07_01000 [Acidimicrobiales bacterium]|nr:hypothetical protein [Acidimicrobiales bacterium]